MRIFIILFLSIVFSRYCNAQDPVNWTFTAKKIAEKTYEVRLSASVQEPWHIYSQSTPPGGPLPTKVSFNSNPLITISGKTKEAGKVVNKHEEVFKVDVKYFDGDVEFVQVVKLKSPVKTNLVGTIEFMACNDEECLPPKSIKFSLRLD